LHEQSESIHDGNQRRGNLQSHERNHLMPIEPAFVLKLPQHFPTKNTADTFSALALALAAR